MGIMDNDYFCQDCKNYTPTVFDRSAGDTICTECGLVVEGRSIDETFEWRTFADSGDNGHDPERTGAPVNPFLSSLCTTIALPKNSNGNGSANSEWKKLGFSNRVLENPEKPLTVAFSSLAAKADKLGLNGTILDRAKQIYKEADDLKFCRGRKDEPLTAACLFLACQSEGFPRTLKEISMVGGGATKKEINKVKEQLKKVLGMESTITLPEDLTRRSCSAMGMENKEMKAVNETLENLKEYDIRRTPKSVLAAVMYMVAQVSKDVPNLKEVSEAADVAVGTTKKTYKDLYPYASRILPSWFANVEDLNKLRIP